MCHQAARWGSRRNNTPPWVGAVGAAIARRRNRGRWILPEPVGQAGKPDSVRQASCRPLGRSPRLRFRSSRPGGRLEARPTLASHGQMRLPAVTTFKKCLWTSGDASYTHTATFIGASVNGSPFLVGDPPCSGPQRFAPHPRSSSGAVGHPTIGSARASTSRNHPATPPFQRPSARTFKAIQLDGSLRLRTPRRSPIPSGRRNRNLHRQ